MYIAIHAVDIEPAAGAALRPILRVPHYALYQ